MTPLIVNQANSDQVKVALSLKVRVQLRPSIALAVVHLATFMDFMEGPVQVLIRFLNKITFMLIQTKFALYLKRLQVRTAMKSMML